MTNNHEDATAAQNALSLHLSIAYHPKQACCLAVHCSSETPSSSLLGAIIDMSTYDSQNNQLQLV